MNARDFKTYGENNLTYYTQHMKDKVKEEELSKLDSFGRP